MTKPDIRLYNTLSRQVETLKPITPGEVKLYVCGPTVYDEAHLGHARCYITWDVLYRFLSFSGLKVHYTRNITDVDDKIINRAKENNESPSNLAERYTRHFHDVMAQLNIASPEFEPKATDYIPQMIQFISNLIEKGFAYVGSSGTVYFDTSQKANYGNLCHQNLEDLKSGARVEVNPEKKSPLDFALWKSEPDQSTLGWPSPWGYGRPGWHIECSTMSYQLLGKALDIHAGGMDLIFPHHQNEIAQSEAFTGHEPFVNIWMHNGFVNVSGEKMSKSLGNFSTIAKLLGQYNANTIRYFILTNHYRSPVDFNTEALEGAQNRIQKIEAHIQRLLSVFNVSPRDLEKECQSGFEQLDKQLNAWYEAMASDLNTAKALSQINEMLQEVVSESVESHTTDAQALEANVQKFKLFLAASQVMGFDFLSGVQSSNEQLQHLKEPLLKIYERLQPDEAMPPSGAEPEALIHQLIQLRSQARDQKNWALSDTIRDELAAIGIVLEDRKDKTTGWIYEPAKATASP